MHPVRASVQVKDLEYPRYGQAGVVIEHQGNDCLVRFDLEDQAGQRDELVTADKLLMLGTN